MTTILHQIRTRAGGPFQPKIYGEETVLMLHGPVYECKPFGIHHRDLVVILEEELHPSCGEAVELLFEAPDTPGLPSGDCQAEIQHEGAHTVSDFDLGALLKLGSRAQVDHEQTRLGAVRDALHRWPSCLGAQQHAGVRMSEVRPFLFS
jgi:hypothetical protein